MVGLSAEDQEKIARAFQRPDKPLLAKTSQDKVVLPALSIAALLGVLMPSYLVSPGYVASRDSRSSESVVAEVQLPIAAPKVEEPIVSAPITPAPAAEDTKVNNELQTKEEAGKRLVEQNQVVQAQAPSQTVGDLLARSANCADIKACIEIMLEATDPRSPEAISIAATRIGEQNKAQRGDRKSARALNQLGLDEFKKKNFTGAIDYLKQASVADPADVEILSNLGFVALQANRSDDAVTPLIDALLLDPRRTSTWVPISELYVIRGKNENAVKALLLGYEFSGNKDKTFTVFEEKSMNAERESMRPIFAEAARKISEIRNK
jgi:tetratricopeptide (TPR) repeat protein